MDAPSQSIQVLLHNLSHSDLVLSVNDDRCSLPQSRAIARPKFGNFKELASQLLTTVDKTFDKARYSSENDVSAFRVKNVFFERRGDEGLADANAKKHSILTLPKYTRQRSGSGSEKWEMKPVSGSDPVPVGFDLKAEPVEICNSASLRFRRDDRTLVFPAGSSSERCKIDGAYFPLLTMLLPKWIDTINSESGEGQSRGAIKKVVVLITGRGAPRDTSASASDNSTKYTGILMRKFIECVYPDIHVIHVHSQTNLFRYDENIVFVKRELLPIVDSIRNELCDRVGAKWRSAMRVTLSFADGSSARISAINASLRHYRPNYMHFWQLKTFWSENIICDDDIESHTFEEISTEPAVQLEQTEPNVQLVVAEMKRFVDEFKRVISDNSIENDLSSFWLRKTKKPVLAVLLVQKAGSLPRLYRGTNMEVSMPTGSLCAERNVIGSALADDITLKRQDLRIIAVYSAVLPMDDKPVSSRLGGKPSGPVESPILCSAVKSPVSAAKSPASGSKGQASVEVDGSVTHVLRGASEEYPWPSGSEGSAEVASTQSSVLGQKRKIMNIPIKMQIMDSFDGSFIVEESKSGGLPVTPLGTRSSSRNKAGGGSHVSQEATGVVVDSGRDVGSSFSTHIKTLTTSASKSTTKTRRKSTPFTATAAAGSSSSYGHLAEDLATTVPVLKTIFVDEQDMNPLKPCGACHEWLKKIAEINTKFCVVTFTDANFTGLYIEQIKGD